jgi:hypothetical protein
VFATWDKIDIMIFFQTIIFIFLNLEISFIFFFRPQEVQRDGKGFEIYTAGLEFESERAHLVRA